MNRIGFQHQLKSSLKSHQFVFLMGLGCLSCRRSNARARQRSCNSPTEQLPPPCSTLVFLRVQSNWPGNTQRPADFTEPQVQKLSLMSAYIPAIHQAPNIFEFDRICAGSTAKSDRTSASNSASKEASSKPSGTA